MVEDDEQKSGRFARGVEESMKPKRPGFGLEEKRGTSERVPTGDYRGTEVENGKSYAAESLGRAERNAGSSINASEEEREKKEQQGGLYRAIEEEENPQGSGLYRSTGEEKKKKKGVFKKYGGLMTIFIALLVGVITSFMSVSSELVAWKENAYSMFGQNAATMNVRSAFLMRTLLSTNRSTTATNIFGKEKFKINKRLAAKLSAQGIDYVETDGADGGKLKMLVFHAEDGTNIPIVANEGDLGRIKTGDIDIGDGTIVKVADGGMTIGTARQRLTDFDVKYNNATMTFAGKIAGWFDNLGNNMIKRLLGTDGRNKMNLDPDSDDETVKKKLYSPVEASDDGTDMDKHPEYEEDPDGEDGPETGSEKTYEDDTGRKQTVGEVDAEDGKITGDVSQLESKLKSTAKKAMLGGTIGCAFLRAIGSISTTVGAIQTMNSVNYAAKYLELADKIKAGDATNVTNTAANALGEEVTVTGYDLDGNEKELTGSVVSSPGFNNVFSMDEVIDEDAPETVAVNREMAFRTALRQLGMGKLAGEIVSNLASLGSGIQATMTCNAIQMGAAAFNVVSDVVLLFTGPVGFGIKKLIQQIATAFMTSLVMAAVSAVIGIILPTVARWLGDNLKELLAGRIGGTVMWAGAQSMMNSNLQMSTGRLVDDAGAEEVYAMTKETEREWARYEQETRSPFDTSSQYTFLGSIVNSLRPVINTSRGNAVTTISSVANLAGEAALALASPAASAAGEVTGYSLSLASEGTCPRLQSVGVAGTETCHKYNGAYVGEMKEVDPELVYNKLESYGAFDGEYSDGNPKINKKSEYAKFVLACVANDTQPGEMSAVVQGFWQKIQHATGNVVTDSLINAAVNATPFIGDMADFFDGATEWGNVAWNSGAACTGKVDTPGDGYADPLSERVKYYSLYNLDQRSLESMEITETNSTVAFLDDYYEENPLDNSYEGMIARYSGQTKEEVTDTLAFMDYVIAVMNYDPEERYAFGEDPFEVEKPLRLDGESEVEIAQKGAVMVNLMQQVVLADVRNRVMMV